jgi:hypothetical protein
MILIVSLEAARVSVRVQHRGHIERDFGWGLSDDVRVFQVFPCYSLLSKVLWVFTMLVNGPKRRRGCHTLVKFFLL